MPSVLRPRNNTRNQKDVVTGGKKRMRDIMPNVQPVSGSKRRRRTSSTDTVPNKKTACQKAVDDDDIIRDFRITIHPQKFRPVHPGNVPLEHQIKFDHIQQLGQIKFDSYALQPRADILNKPWEHDNKRRAERIIEVATRSRKEYQNEDGWRMAVENRIFERFEIEVACQQCRKRLWQSCIQAEPSGSNSWTPSLAERQKRRTVCECEPVQKLYSILGTGLSDIFSFRIGERSIIQNDSEDHHHVEKKPDRIYGLRTTGAIDKILQQPRFSHFQEDYEFKELLLDRLTVSCNPDSGGRASIYPFLVLEAKSNKADSDFQKIERQTALPIRNHLYLQLKLQEDEFNRMKVPGGPLSWFVAYISEAWRVYGCYVTKSNPDDLPYYNIVLLWEGSITGYDEALQLVLIVDYIVDWARDIYRPSIMRQLMSVADQGSRSTYTIIEEPDILSIPGYATTWLGDRPGGSIAGVRAIEPPANKAFDALDFNVEPSLEPLYESTGEYVDIRVWDSAKYVSQVRGLYITDRDAVTTVWFVLFRSISQFQHMRDCWILLSCDQDIKTIEQIWTESQEIKDINHNSKQRVLISLYVHYGTTENGLPVRELMYFALSEALGLQHSFREGRMQQEDLYVSAEELGLKLREGWASSNRNYFLNYAAHKTSALCVTASDFDRISGRVSLSFREDDDTKSDASSLHEFITKCETSQEPSYKDYETCLRYTRAIYSLVVAPHCVENPAQACAFLNGEASLTSFWVYVTSMTSGQVDTTWLVRQVLQMLDIYLNYRGIKGRRTSQLCYRDSERKSLLWIASDPQWKLYLAIKSSMIITPGLEKVHRELARYRKVLLRHDCVTESPKRAREYRRGYENVICIIREICKTVLRNGQTRKSLAVAILMENRTRAAKTTGEASSIPQISL